MLIALLVRCAKDIEERKQLLRTSGLLLLNVPIAIVYFWLGIVLINTMRITVVNNTKSIVTDARFTGCDIDKRLEKLEPGQSKTISFNIPGDCGVSVRYKQNGKVQDEDVTGYVTNEGGAWLTYNLGGPNDRY